MRNTGIHGRITVAFLALALGVISSVSLADSYGDIKKQILAKPDATRIVAVDGALHRAHDTPTRSARTPLPTEQFGVQPLPAGYEDVDQAQLTAEILVFPEGSAVYLDAVLFACDSPTLPQCGLWTSSDPPAAFEDAVRDLVKQMSFVVADTETRKLLRRIVVQFAADPGASPQVIIGGVGGECDADCCQAVGGDVIETTGGDACDVLPGSDDEQTEQQHVEFQTCKDQNC